MPENTHLNEDQLEAIHHKTGPLLIIAGAGTGKTTVLTQRIENLILKENVSPGNILALTFTEKAASEMQTRIDEIMPYGYSDMWIETFHAFCDRILRQNAIHIGLSPQYRLLTQAESMLFLKRNIFSFNLDYFTPIGNPSKFIQGLLQHFSRLKDDDITPNDYRIFIEKLENDDHTLPDQLKELKEISHAFTLYESLKKQNDVMDFSDLISNTLKLFRDRPTILKEYQEIFHYILVDEFQDTNYAQNELAILLSGNKKNITVVGDDDQSIYRWRGAAISNMLQFRSHFPNSKIVALTKNYRSSQVILDHAYRLIQFNNPDRLEIKEGINKKLIALNNTAVDPVDILLSKNVDEEAEKVVKEIKKGIKEKTYTYKDFAILVRANDHALPFQKALERAGIPCEFLGPTRLFEQNEIKDIIAYLHVLTNLEDDSSVYRTVSMPIFDITPRDVAMLLSYAKSNNQTLFQSIEKYKDIDLTNDGKIKIERILQMINKHLGQITKYQIGEIVYSFFEDSGLLGHYLDPKTTKTQVEAENIALFFTKLQSYAQSEKDTTIFSAVEWLDISIGMGDSPLANQADFGSQNTVNIMTVHSSKGLEFPVVFVVNLVTQRFPSRDRKEQIPVHQDLIKESLPTGDENLQEERRLFYVAITRAKNRLYLCASYHYGGGKRERKLSPFINETIGQEALNKIIKNIKEIDSAAQLSLLDIANDSIKNSSQNSTRMLEKKSLHIPYISYSQIQTFDTCPLHYKLSYILKVPSPPSPALSYGSSVHATLATILKLIISGNQISNEMAEDTLKNHWIKKGYVNSGHEQKAYSQALEMLKKYTNTLNLKTPKTVGIEIPFNFHLDALRVGGRIDRIDDLSNNKIEIIDYKTGKNTPDEKKLANDLQLTLYALAAMETKMPPFNKNPEEVLLTLLYVESGESFSTTRTMDQLTQAKSTIVEKVAKISESDFQCSKSILCKNCEYSMICNA